MTRGDPDGGYGGPLPEDGTVKNLFTVRLDHVMGGSSPVAIVERDREPIGALRCQNKEEFEWLKKRITGTRSWTPSKND